MSKLELVKKFCIGNNIFICPICRTQLDVVNNSLICSNNHTFDLSKRGSIVLYKTSNLKFNKLYTKELFYNRSNFILCGYYKKMHNIICNILEKNKSKIVLDMGSGDGTHDGLILENFKDMNIIGVDLAKDGVDLSCKYINYGMIPIIGDLHNLPIKDNSVDVVLNILSPLNEKEVRRVLKEDGIIIKVTPKKEYLQELRSIIDVTEYKNENTIINNLEAKYDVIEKINIIDSYKITNDIFKFLIKMTPLTNHKDIKKSICYITIALNILVLKVKK